MKKYRDRTPWFFLLVMIRASARQLHQRRRSTVTSDRKRQLAIGEGVQVIRVSLLTAVRFIIDLERREEAAFPSPYIATDRSLGPHTDNISFGTITASDWADEIFQNIHEKGVDNVEMATSAMSQLRARERGESRQVEFSQFSSRWK